MGQRHAGLKNAFDKQLQGAGWQRCRVHFLRNALAQCFKDTGEIVTATIPTIFHQPNADAVRQLPILSDVLLLQSMH